MKKRISSEKVCSDSWKSWVLGGADSDTSHAPATPGLGAAAGGGPGPHQPQLSGASPTALVVCCGDSDFLCHFPFPSPCVSTMTSDSWMCFQIPLRRHSSRRHRQMECLHLLLQARPPRPRPSLEDAGDVHAQRHQLGWGWQDSRSSASSGFFQGFSSRSPKHVSVSPRSSCRPLPTL